VIVILLLHVSFSYVISMTNGNRIYGYVTPSDTQALMWSHRWAPPLSIVRRTPCVRALSHDTSWCVAEYRTWPK